MSGMHDAIGSGFNLAGWFDRVDPCRNGGFIYSLSVIIPVYNGVRTLGAQLDALAEQRWDEPWEVIVADNGSTDGTPALVRRYRDQFRSLRVVDASQRRGAPHASNVGARAARGRSLVFCDADDVAGAGWLAAIGRALEYREFVASRLESDRLNPTWVRSSRSRCQWTGLQHLWYPPYCPHAGGSGLGVRRSLFASVGGFDEDLLYLHDTDFCVRLFLEGVALYFVPEAVMHVRFRDRLHTIFRQSRLWAEYNMCLQRRYLDLGETAADAWALYRQYWVRLVRRIMRARRRSDLGRLSWSLGQLIGLLRGAVRYGVPPVAASMMSGLSRTSEAEIHEHVGAADAAPDGAGSRSKRAKSLARSSRSGAAERNEP